MSFRDAVIVCLKEKYADFTGRARRREFWFFVLFSGIVAGLIGSLFTPSGSLFSPGFLWTLAILCPQLAVGWRRMHDLGKPGYYYIFIYIPFINIYALYLLCKEGIPSANEYGPNPKDPDAGMQIIGTANENKNDFSESKPENIQSAVEPISEAKQDTAETVADEAEEIRQEIHEAEGILNEILNEQPKPQVVPEMDIIQQTAHHTYHPNDPIEIDVPEPAAPIFPNPLEQTSESDYIICPECGNKNNSTYKFCSLCGSKLK